jgi:uncharacterized cupredoxin-like copper-binding protein
MTGKRFAVNRLAGTIALPLLLLVAAIAAHTAQASAGKSARPLAAKTVRVTAGKPSELKFALSTRTVRVGAVVFTITNRGAIVHDFKVCTTPRRTSAANTCDGKSSRKLTPGQSVKLTVRFKKKGSYEYLCTIPGHAAAGMKGILRVT